MSRGFRRYGGWLLGGAVLGVLVAALAVGLYTRTDWGRERILALTLQALGGRLNGKLEVARLDGNVLTGARLYGVTVADAQSIPIVQADSAYLRYDLPTFLGGDIVIRELVLFDPEVLLVRLPADSMWNYQRLLQDTTQQTGGAAGRATLIERIRMENAHVTVRLPFVADPDLSPAAQRAELRDALSDTSRLVVEEVDDGYLRTMRFEVATAVASDVLIAPDDRGGTYLRVDSAVGDAFLYTDPPLRVRGLEGELTLREGVMRFTAPAIALPDSRLSAVGVVDLTGEELAYDVEIVADRVALVDLQWLYPPFPEEGAAGGTLWIETRPEGLLFRTRDLALTAPGTRLRGDLTLVVGDTLRFVEAELTADPLNVETVERMLPAGLPVEGLRIGSVEIRGTGA